MGKFTALWVVIGSFAGVVGYTRLAGALDVAYRPFQDDTHAWLIYAVPTGAVLGGVTASAICSHLAGRYSAAATKCVLVGAALAFCYFMMFRSTRALYNAAYAWSESGPALIWCGALLIYGLFLMQKAFKRQP